MSAVRFEVLHEVFEAQADARPEAVAVVCEGREATTYAELEARANRLAHYLRSRGVHRGALVGILLPRSPDAYAALLGVLKAGAAYVPIDPDYPEERISYILSNSEAGALVTTASLAKKARGFQGAVIRLDADGAEIDALSPGRLVRDFVGVGPRDLCYVIYTSGSTGRPKGVMIEHRSACNLVLAEGEIYRVREWDRVCQAASISFDLSVEEIWMAFRAGATLVVASQEQARSGSDFGLFLAENRVTVLSCVPTLLTMMGENVPTLRLIILGGESCPDWLVERWMKPGRRMFNTYGPTETTVIATYAEVAAEKPVTIGVAVPGYRVYVLDENLQRVPDGSEGEICIGGVGVARGYVGLPEETEARFVPDPFGTRKDARLYRTGDLGRYNAEGELEFLGRRDGQVKLRGFRIELPEIESVMMQQQGVLAAACTVREDVPGVQQLVGYVVPRDGAELYAERLRSQLRERLPSYMVPACIESLDELPRLPSGKLDRASLPAPAPRVALRKSPAIVPMNDMEGRIGEVWSKFFPSSEVSLDDDFFLDLGGHSLLAARMVSELRKEEQFADVSVRDVYEHTTIRSLAKALRSREHRIKPLSTNRSDAATPKRHRREVLRINLRASILQTLGLYPIFAFGALQWVTPYLVFFLLFLSGHPLLYSVEWALVATVLVFPILLAVTVAAKWLLLGRIRPERHPLWSGYYLRFWFVQSLVAALPLHFLAGTPLLPIVYRLLGAHIGSDVDIATNHIAAFDLVSIGEGSTIDDDAMLLGYSVEHGEMILGTVQVGRRCFVGCKSILREDTVMEDGARLEDLSLLPRGGRIPEDETWAGSPARPSPDSEVVLAPRPPVGRLRHSLVTMLYGALIMGFPVLQLAAILPGIVILFGFDPLVQPLQYFVAIPLAGALFVFLLMGEMVLLKWLLVGRARSGRYPVHGSFYIRNWVFDQMHELILDLVAPIHATLYVAPWYRALGARIGKSVELSTAAAATPDLLELEDGATVADEAALGAAHMEGGWLTIAKTHLGRRAFVGNSAVIPAGTVLGDGSLCGVLSIPPARQVEASQSSVTWLGSPPLRLPRREVSDVFSEEHTYRPSRRARLIRGLIEIFRVTLPPAGFIVVTTAVLEGSLWLLGRFGLGVMLLSLPALFAGACVGVALFVVLMKWLVIGRYRPFETPLWSTFVWRLELVNSLYEFLATPLVLDALRGTPLLPAYLRMLGVKIGRGVYVGTTGFLEWDLVEIGEGVALNSDCVLQTHLFEDRVLKASHLRVGARCDVGAGSVVLYDSEMEEDSRMDALSLLMKGERLPTGTSWVGIPARRSDLEVEPLVAEVEG